MRQATAVVIAIFLGAPYAVTFTAFAQGTDPITPRWGHTVTELANGHLLIAGGENGSGLVAAVEVYDPVAGTSEPAGSLSSPRRRHTALRLNDGRVLLAGGEGASGVLSTAEVFNPATKLLSEISLVGARADHTATRLPDGTVLLAGGHNGTSTLVTLQIFDPVTNAVTDGADLAAARRQHTATVLDDGRVLLVGGRDDLTILATTEYWNQTTDTVTNGPTLTTARFGHTATRIPPLDVAIVGGTGAIGELKTTEVFRSSDGAFYPAGSLANVRTGHAAVVLPDNGHLMILGGLTEGVATAAVELMHPYDRSFLTLAELDRPRSDLAAAIVGPNVVVPGGKSAVGTALGSIAAVPFATLTSDLPSYLPNATVTLAGEFWQPNEDVTLAMVTSDAVTTTAAVADAAGKFFNTDFSTGDNAGKVFFVTAVGAVSGKRAALDFTVLVPPPPGAWSFSPSQITQTISPVPLVILGGFYPAVTQLHASSHCKTRVIGICVETRVITTYVQTQGVRVKGTRADTNIDVLLAPASITTSRIDVPLPPAVTSNADSYGVAVRQREKVIETCTATGFIPCGTKITDYERDSAFVPLTVVPVDSTPPAIVLAVDGAPNAGGWYTGSVAISWSVTDPESAISSTTGCSSVAAVADTAGTTFTCSATSSGGSSTESVTIKRDASPPDAALSVVNGTLGSNGWYVSPVTVRTTGADTVSTPVTCTADQFQNTDTGGAQFSGSCTNAAGLQTTALALTIKLDQAVPTISAAATPAANAAGWYQGDVTVAFTCADALSGMATCPASQTLSATGSSTSQVATDAAGNTSAPSNVIAVKIDKTPPQVALNGGPAHGSDFYFGEVPAAPSCSGSDGVSGLASCIVSGYGTGVGTHTVIATATDVAGNVSVASATYTVLAWTFAGFYHPVDMGGVVNTVKGGSTVPLRFEAFAGPTELVDTAAVKQPLIATQSVCGSAATSDIELLATGDTSLRYDAATGQFVYNWKTPRLAGYCYVVTVTLQDGTSRSALFRLK